MPTPNWRGLASSVRGASHIRHGAPNQDSGGFRALPNHSGLLLSVADGHGDKIHARSDRGSRFAVAIALDLLEQAVVAAKGSAPRDPAPLCAEIKERLLSSWWAAVDADLAADPASPPPTNQDDASVGRGSSERVLYGTTLIAAALTATYAIYLQIGDGDLVVVTDDESVRYPLPRRTDLPRNQTDSLCHDDALRRLRAAVELFEDSPPPSLVLLSSDGYANSFGTDTAFQQVALELGEHLKTKGLAGVAERMDEWLTQTSAEGSGDDITVAIGWSGSQATADTLRQPSRARATAITQVVESIPPGANRKRWTPQAVARAVATGVLAGALLFAVGQTLLTWPGDATGGSPAAAETRSGEGSATQVETDTETPADVGS
ncbi:MAG: hypothetical protein HW416_3267 [Chloroflexi bacterium]|nr:hypothetical protein [Chloroflexota bacterium]